MSFTLNGAPATPQSAPTTSLLRVLRDELGLKGTKEGCGAGDCGACTVLVDGRQAYACLLPLGQLEGADVRTVEGLAPNGQLSALQESFRRHDAAQCGFCTAGMLMAATDLLERNPGADEAAVREALSGVLCRCTGYQAIIEAVLDARPGAPVQPAAGEAIGSRAARHDSLRKIAGQESYGADAIPADALWARIVRSPHHRARFALGDMAPVLAAHPGLARIFTARDVPNNSHGYTPSSLDQPAFADGVVRHHGEAVLALVGEREAVMAIPDSALPITWEPEEPIFGVEPAIPGDRLVQQHRKDNLLIASQVISGDVAAALPGCAAVAEGTFRTPFVEHAYMEPEAGWARRIGDRLEIHVATQGPYFVRNLVAHMLALPEQSVHVKPTAVGGAFGGKFDMTVHPIVALAAWQLNRPVACVLGREESMACSTKRHPSVTTARFGADAEGRLLMAEVRMELDTGAYTSAGPTVAIRVPIHAAGPYRVPNQHNAARAWFTNVTPAGGFRGFGIPQVAIAHEGLLDELAAQLGLDAWDIRRRNALRVGDVTATGQGLEHSAGLPACLDALKPTWDAWQAECAAHNAGNPRLRRGVGIGCMWYGIGATSQANPSTMHVGLAPDGRLTLFSGVVDLGQGGNTAMLQIAADALGVKLADVQLVWGDTDRTSDGGKTSASRQTFVSGNATVLACADLLAQLRRLANAGPEARVTFQGNTVRVAEEGRERLLDLRSLPVDERGEVLRGTATYDPPAGKLDAKGQGTPYATYAFGAQIALLDVDLDLGLVHLRRIAAAHDVGRAINPAMVEGQIQGGIAQGIGFALFEEYAPGVNDNLHDYLVPTTWDVPPIDCILVEDQEPQGPGGAKGVGEPALIPTAAAILGAIRHATGARLRQLPATPPRVMAALKATSQA